MWLDGAPAFLAFNKFFLKRAVIDFIFRNCRSIFFLNFPKTIVSSLEMLVEFSTRAIVYLTKMLNYQLAARCWLDSCGYQTLGLRKIFDVVAVRAQQLYRQELNGAIPRKLVHFVRVDYAGVVRRKAANLTNNPAFR